MTQQSDIQRCTVPARKRTVAENHHAEVAVAKREAVFVDLDGTLLRSDNTIGPADYDTLVQLRSDNVLTAAITGRSLLGARRVLPPDCPIDYLAASIGAAIVAWKTQTLFVAPPLPGDDVARVVEYLVAQDRDFMVHAAVPDNHYLHFWRSKRPNPDFDHRLCRYQEFATPLATETETQAPATQFVVIEESMTSNLPTALASEFPHLSIVCSTSPLDHKSLWVEVHPAHACKAEAAQWLLQRHSVDHTRTLAIGNDYNDTELLNWAQSAAVVANAPLPLTKRHPVVASHNDNGFSEAVARWRRAEL